MRTYLEISQLHRIDIVEMVRIEKQFICDMNGRDVLILEEYSSFNCFRGDVNNVELIKVRNSVKFIFMLLHYSDFVLKLDHSCGNPILQKVLELVTF